MNMGMRGSVGRGGNGEWERGAPLGGEITLVAEEGKGEGGVGEGGRFDNTEGATHHYIFH